MKAFKKTFFLLLIFGLTISCSDKNYDLIETYPNEIREYIKSNSYKTLVKTFPNLSKGLDFNSILEYTDNEIITYSFKSNLNGQPLGVLYFSEKSENQFQTIVELYSYDENGNLEEVQFSNLLGQKIISAKIIEIDKEVYSIKIINNQNSTNKRGWWSCTRGCVGDAWAFCSNDPECDYLCAAAGGYLGCTASIAVACAGWCAVDSDNDLTPE